MAAPYPIDYSHKSGFAMPNVGHEADTFTRPLFKIGVTGTKVHIKTASIPLAQIYSTSALAASTVDVMVINHTNTVASNSGYTKGLQVTLTSAVKTGGSFRAIYGKIDYSTNGYAWGQAAVIGCELVMPSNDVINHGFYYCFQGQIGGGNAVNANPFAFMDFRAYGNMSTVCTTASTYLFHLEGIAATDGGLWEAEDVDNPDFTHAIRVRILDADYWIGLSTAVAFNA